MSYHAGAFLVLTAPCYYAHASSISPFVIGFLLKTFENGRAWCMCWHFPLEYWWGWSISASVVSSSNSSAFVAASLEWEHQSFIVQRERAFSHWQSPQQIFLANLLVSIIRTLLLKIRGKNKTTQSTHQQSCLPIMFLAKMWCTHITPLCLSIPIVIKALFLTWGRYWIGNIILAILMISMAQSQTKNDFGSEEGKDELRILLILIYKLLIRSWVKNQSSLFNFLRLPQNRGKS